MTIYEFIIAAVDEPEKHRKNAGEVIAVKEYPHLWGRKELCKYLVVLADLPLKLSEVTQLLEKVPLPWKRKYSGKIDFVRLKEVVPILDLDKLTDINCAYQPFKKDKQVTSCDVTVDTGSLHSQEIILTAKQFKYVFSTEVLR